MVPVDNPVYAILDIMETRGGIPLQPMARPYSARRISSLLHQGRSVLSSYEWEQVSGLLEELGRIGEGADLIKDGEGENPVVFGGNLSGGIKKGFFLPGEDGETPSPNGESITSEVTAAVSGSLSDNLFYQASLGVALERYAPDLFYSSSVKNDAVNFSYEHVGYAELPYQFTYDTAYWHANAVTYHSGSSPIATDLHYGFSYGIETTGLFFDDTMLISANNLHHSWGSNREGRDLLLSEATRRFPAIEFRLQPRDWVSYSYLTGTLFHYPQQNKSFKFSIYETDLGSMQKNYTIQSVELMPASWISLGLTSANIWPKRFELGYMVPFLLPFFVQIDQADSDNLAMEVDLNIRIPKVGRGWFTLFMDEISFDVGDNFLKMARNRYAYQTGWESSLPSWLMPLAKLTLNYTRITPYVYTHYPEDDFGVTTYDETVVVGEDDDGNLIYDTITVIRPVDQTFTHDGFNLGYPLPPNSDELRLTLNQIVSREFHYSFDGALIRHGTNDIADVNSGALLLTGDVYMDQNGSVYSYPLMDFTKDGIYDWTLLAEASCSWRPKGFPFTLHGSLGYAKTWWVANESGVAAPEPREMINGGISFSL